MITISQSPSNFSCSPHFQLARLLTFSPKINVFKENSQYQVYTANSYFELHNIFKLRHQCFYSNKKKKIFQYDIDQYDYLCDHLIVKEKKTHKIIGTYRLLFNPGEKGFYSESEFNLNDFIQRNQNENILELGRACIHHHHRNGFLIDLLWKAIGQYINKGNFTLLIGLSSLMDSTYHDALELKRYFLENNLIYKMMINERAQYTHQNHAQNKSSFIKNQKDPTYNYFKQNEKTLFIPPLIKSYMKANCKFSSNFAFDNDINCFDFLTILNVSDLSRPFQKRYLR